MNPEERIVWQHRERPKYYDLVATVGGEVSRQGDILQDIRDSYDLDTAKGVQLDVLGEWLGVDRKLKTPISGVYFEWQGTVETGWGEGVWRGKYDNGTTVQSLPDDIYRAVLKGRALLNRWDGTFVQLKPIFEQYASAVSHELTFDVKDHQDMSVDVTISGGMPDIVWHVYQEQFQDIRPAGVTLTLHRG